MEKTLCAKCIRRLSAGDREKLAANIRAGGIAGGAVSGVPRAVTIYNGDAVCVEHTL